MYNLINFLSNKSLRAIHLNYYFNVNFEKCVITVRKALVSICKSLHTLVKFHLNRFPPGFLNKPKLLLNLVNCSSMSFSSLLVTYNRRKCCRRQF